MAGAQGQAEKQGYLGNLEKKSRSELQDLLNRQEKLLQNKQFISKLADKGNRIRALVEQLRSILELHGVVDNTADMLQKMAIDADEQHRERTKYSLPGEENLIQQIINKDAAKQIEDERNEVSITEDKDELEEEHRTFINSYEKVIRGVEQKRIQSGTEGSPSFKPHRSIKTRNIYDVPADKLAQLKKSSASPPGDSTQESSDKVKPETQTVVKKTKDTDSKDQNTNSNKSRNKQWKTLTMLPVVAGRENSRRKYRYDDSLEMDVTRGPLKHEPTKIISVEESVKVLEKQQQVHKKLQATMAAERLAKRLHIKVGDFNPEGASSFATTYRDIPTEFDSDDSETEQDYPD